MQGEGHVSKVFSKQPGLVPLKPTGAGFPFAFRCVYISVSACIGTRVLAWVLVSKYMCTGVNM